MSSILEGVPSQPRKGLKESIKKHPIITALATTAALGTVALAADQTIPAVREGISAISNLFGQKAEVPTVLDKNNLKQIIGDSNIVDISPRDMRDLPQFDSEGKPLILVATPSRGNTATLTKSADYRSSSVGIPPTTDGMYNMLNVDGIQANEPIPIPHDGYLFVVKGVYKPGAIDLVQVFFQLPNGNLAYLNFTTEDTRVKLPPEIDNAPISKGGSEIFQNNNWKNGLPVRLGDSGLLPLEDGHVKYTIQEIDPFTLAHLPGEMEASTTNGKLPRKN